MKTKLALGLALLFAACGGEDRPAVVGPGPGGSSGGGFGKGGTSGSSGSTGDSGAAGAVDEPGSPTVTITSPEALAHPNDGQVILDDEVEVICTATKSLEPGSMPVNPASVELEARDASGTVVADSAGAPTNSANEYSGTLIIATIPNGPVSFHCSVSDTSAEPLVGTDTVSTFVDHGPTITVKSPLPDSPQALGFVRFEFNVDPAPLADGDDGAAVDIGTVELDVNGIPITIANSQDSLFATDVNLNDPLVFPTKPMGAVPVVIRAANVRAPTAGDSFESYSFAVDGTGPVITITSPDEDEDIIGGQETLTFSVVDALVGVDPLSVVVKINDVEHRFDPTDNNWTLNDDVFTFRIDSRNIEGSVAQLLINIEAADTVGNVTTGIHRTLFLDELPPIVDLDPGNVRERRQEGTEVYCSESFDPLGDGNWPEPGVPAFGMPNDTTTIVNFVLPRALVWDRTNRGAGQNFLYYSATNRDDVYLYLHDDTDAPFLIDTDDDDGNVCDDIDRTTVRPFLKLTNVAPNGLPWLSDEGDVAPPMSGCTLKSDPQPPDTLCGRRSDLRRVIAHEITGGQEPAIYAKGTLTDIQCTGGEWEITPIAAEGWLCLAAVATDGVGNRGVSAPLRLCFDDQALDGEPACASDPSNPPSCMTDCTMPPRFQAQLLDIEN